MNEQAHHPRWQLIRNLLVFQAKLVIDGLRDVVLSPISLFAALAGLVAHRQDPQRYFRRVIEVGAASERWINLFGRPADEDQANLDELFDRLEQRVVDQYQRGGLTAQTKRAIDRSLDTVHRRLDGLSSAARGSEDDQPPAGPP